MLFEILPCCFDMAPSHSAHQINAFHVQLPEARRHWEAQKWARRFMPMSFGHIELYIHSTTVTRDHTRCPAQETGAWDRVGMSMVFMKRWPCVSLSLTPFLSCSGFCLLPSSPACPPFLPYPPAQHYHAAFFHDTAHFHAFGEMRIGYFRRLSSGRSCRLRVVGATRAKAGAIENGVSRSSGHCCQERVGEYREVPRYYAECNVPYIQRRTQTTRQKNRPSRADRHSGCPAIFPYHRGARRSLLQS